VSLHPLAGRAAPPDSLVRLPRLLTDYFSRRPDPSEPAQRVSFGTSGHRGSAHLLSFNQDHVAAIAQAVCDVRREQGTTGPLFLGFDTHALSEAAYVTAVEVCAANQVELRVDEAASPTPTPVVSHAILAHNRTGQGRADGVVITPSHNPPEDGGFKYNPPSGGPAPGELTSAIEAAANRYLERDLEGVRRMPLERALAASTTRRHDYVTPYVDDLGEVVELSAAASAGLRIGVDPMGGAAVHYWPRIAERWGLTLEVVNPVVDATFRDVRVDADGKIRMDCSSPHAMAGLIELRDRYDVAFGNDPDADRHGIVVPSAGLLNPNHYLAVAVDYLFRQRGSWSAAAAIGKTLVSSSMIDRVAADLGRRVVEVPVGFKWFVDGLLDGSLAFGGEESAGASFARLDGSVWTTDKDGILLALLAAEITAGTGRDPGEHYRALEEKHGSPLYARTSAPATLAQKAALAALRPEAVTADTLAGERILARLSHAPGNGAAIGGLKVVTEGGWFAARPSGTEDVYKIYAESFRGGEHLARVQEEARELVDRALASA
jgi:phosphoglucomutase